MQAEPLLPPPGLAVDLGCGVGHSERFLVERGWQVLAIDLLPEAIAHAEAQCAGLDGIEFVCADFRTCTWPANQLTLGFNAIFFVPTADFWQVWESLRERLTPGGLFIGQVLGSQDDWANEAMGSIRPEEEEQLLAGFSPLHFEHVTRPGRDVFGREKHWDVYHCILQRT